MALVFFVVNMNRKRKWGLGEKGDVKVGKKDNNGRKYMENRAMGNLLFLVFSI